MTATEIGSLEHRYLRSAIEFAVAIAEAGQRLKPPLTYPAELKPYLRRQRVPAAALAPLRRAIEADDTFRRRLAAGAQPELVDPVGIEWLRRDDGWQERVAALVAAADEEVREADAAARLRRAERRREAAEQVAARTRAELVAHQARIEELERQLGEARAAHQAAAMDARQLAEQLTGARTAERHANDRAEAARSRLAAAEAATLEQHQRVEAAESQRDALLAERAERAGVALGATPVTELRDLAQSARALAERLGALVEVGEPARQPIALPGGVARDSQRATEHLLRAAGAVVVVDGYNVAKLGWPDEVLATQRDRLLDVVDDVARRLGSDLTVIFDGADVVGAHATRRRLARVVYSPAGVSADDVIRATVAATPAGRAVVVVTNDQAVRRSVAAAGANLVTSEAFLAVARR